MKREIAKILHKAIKKDDLKLKEEEIENLIEIPKDPSNGDFAFPCFILASKFKQPPHEIAVDLRKSLQSNKFQDIQAVGPYINFFLDRKELSLDLVRIVSTQKEKFGSSEKFKNKTAFVEFSSPNIAKPFGIGHLRSTIIGNSIAKICKSQGYKVIKANYLGDWGSQFGKLIHAYEKFGDAKKLKEDPIKHLYEIYVKINSNEEYDERSREWFKKLEQGNKEAMNLWKDFKEISLKEFIRIYSLMGINFDLMLGESMYEEEMKKVVQDLKKKKLLQESQGAQVVNLEKDNLGVALIEKSDGTTLYVTRDIASAISRYEKYKFDKMIYEVGQEQTLHFNQLFKILELMKYSWAENCVHVSHGLYLGKDGKRLATRKGKTFFLSEIIEETKELAEKEILKRTPKMSKKELEERSLKIALAAIYYGDLKSNRINNVVFDLERFVSFDGDTGPYLLYSYARAKSILRKIKPKKDSKLEIQELHEKEFALTKKIAEFPSIIERAYEALNPSLIANYAYQLAQLFNEFYHDCPVKGSEQELFRIQLVFAFSQTLKNALNVLGIETLEEM